MNSKAITEIDTYQRLAARTSKTHLPTKDRVLDAAIGLVGEVGELANYLKKGIYHGHMIDFKFVQEELGDSLWYIAELASIHGVKLSQVATLNNLKLIERYPNGYNDKDSRERKR